MVTDTAPSSGKGVRYGAFGRSGGIVGSWWVCCGQSCGNDRGQYGHRHPEKVTLTVELFKEISEGVGPMGPE